MSIRDKLRWGGVAEDQAELVRATKLKTIKNAYGFSRVIMWTTPDNTFASPANGYQHIYRAQGSEYRCGVNADSSNPGDGTLFFEKFTSPFTTYGSHEVQRSGGGTNWFWFDIVLTVAGWDDNEIRIGWDNNTGAGVNVNAKQIIVVELKGTSGGGKPLDRTLWA